MFPATRNHIQLMNIKSIQKSIMPFILIPASTKGLLKRGVDAIRRRFKPKMSTGSPSGTPVALGELNLLQHSIEVSCTLYLGEEGHKVRVSQWYTVTYGVRVCLLDRIQSSCIPESVVVVTSCVPESAPVLDTGVPLASCCFSDTEVASVGSRLFSKAMAAAKANATARHKAWDGLCRLTACHA